MTSFSISTGSGMNRSDEGTTRPPNRATARTEGHVLSTSSHEGEESRFRVGPDRDPDQYELTGPGVGGGEGVTFPGRYTSEFTKPVPLAIKVIAPGGQSASGPVGDILQKWRDQRHVLQNLGGEHVVTVYEIFTGPHPHLAGTTPYVASREGTYLYVVMEYVAGPTLEQFVNERPGELGERIDFILDVAKGLATLHSATRNSGNPMLHRDVKPDNCVIAKDRGAVLIDVTSVRLVTNGRDPEGMLNDFYAAPEVLRDPYGPRDVQSDAYSLGALAYFCITANHPPAANDANAPEIMRTELARAARAAKVPDRDAFVDTVLRMMNSDSSRRPTNLVSWAAELVRLSGGSRLVRQRRLRRRLVVAAALPVIVIGVVALLSRITPLEFDAGPSILLKDFQPFGTTFANFAWSVQEDSVTVSPPGGEGAYSHLWGVAAAANNCAASVEFDIEFTEADLRSGFGLAVAPRSTIDRDEPVGSSIQYEWQPADLNASPGSYVRPAILPGQAWFASDSPISVPDITQVQHVRVYASGDTMSIFIGSEYAEYEIPGPECGGVALRVWGATAHLTSVKIAGS